MWGPFRQFLYAMATRKDLATLAVIAWIDKRMNAVAASRSDLFRSSEERHYFAKQILWSLRQLQVEIVMSLSLDPIHFSHFRTPWRGLAEGVNRMRCALLLRRFRLLRERYKAIVGLRECIESSDCHPIDGKSHLPVDTGRLLLRHYARHFHQVRPNPLGITWPAKL